MRQLQSLSGRARVMLVAMRGARWLAAVLAAFLAAGFIDFLLRLPGWLRLIIGVVGVVIAVAHLVHRLRQLSSVRVTLTGLALRLERMYPQISGRLASAVAFASETAVVERSAIEQAMAEDTRARAQGVLDEKQVAKLIDTTHLLRSLLMLLVVLAVFSTVAIAAPTYISTSFSRWTKPLGSTRWPNRYHVEGRSIAKVAPNNAPLRVEAEVTKGDAANLRTWVVYKFLRPGDNTGGEWQRALMTRQGNGRTGGAYQRLIEPATGADRIVFYFEAGDDATDDHIVQLIQPPTLRNVSLEIEPPGYAAKIIPVEKHDLLQPPRPSVSLDALEGSKIHLRVFVDGSFASLAPGAASEKLAEWVAAAVPGLLEKPTADEAASMQLAFTPGISKEFPAAFELSWTLSKQTQFHFRPSDEYGTAYEDQRQFRLEVRPDRPPRATILQPAGDESVLPTATVELAAEAQDDVAVAQLRLEARQKEKAARPLASESADQARARLTKSLDLASLKLQPGDELALVAIVTDNFLLNGKRHDAVESTPRYLRVISPEEMVRQFRTDLAELRQRALRAQASQSRLLDTPASKAAASQQQELQEQIANMSRSVKSIQERAQKNKLDDKAVKQTLAEGSKVIDDAAKSAQSAADQLAQASKDPAAAQPQTKQQLDAARKGQQKTKADLDKLVQLLDQGRDAYELQQNLIKVSKEQDQLAKQTRETLPKTLGKDKDKLDDKQKQALDKMAEQQKELGEQIKQLAQRMQSTAAAISRQSEKPEDQATAESLKEAASTAMQEGLDEKMKQAGQQVEQNRLAGAQKDQQQAQDILHKMLEQVGKTDKLRQEILQRKLGELADSIRRLRDQQAAQLERLIAAVKLTDLDAPLIALRRNTLAVAEQARSTDPQTMTIADLLEKAAGYQADAASELRNNSASKAVVETAEKDSLTKLNEALKLAEELAAKSQNQKSDEERRELVKAYAKALEQQKQIRDAVAKLKAVKEDARDRRWRAESAALSGKQTEVKDTLGKLREKLEQTVVYMSVHDQLDGWTADAAASLKKAAVDTRLMFNQEMILAAIGSLIEALKPNDNDENFATPTGGNQDGGGGGGQPNQLIPPIAELKLLRGRQDQVYKMTRAIEQTPATADADEKQSIVTDLSKQQDGLAETGLQLIEALKNQQRGGGMPALPGTGPVKEKQQ